MEEIQKKPQLPILFFLFSLANVLGVLYTPALPHLVKYFQITKFQSQQTISFYILGCLLGQLIYAPIANALGRKSAIYLGGLLTILGSILCLFAIEIQSFSFLLFGRTLTALGASCGVILTSTMIADVFTPAAMKKILPYLTIGFAISPALGIAVGGFITEYISWQSCFYFMLLYSFVVMGFCILLPETAKEKSLGHLKIMKIIKSYGKQAGNIQFLLYAGIFSFAAIILTVFSADAPFIATNRLHISADGFGLYNFIPNTGFLLGGFISARLSHKFSSNNLILISSLIFLFVSLIMWLFFALNVVNIMTLFGLPFLIFLVAPVIISQAQSLCLSSSTNKAYASSALFMILFTWVFLSISALGFFPPEYAPALPIVYSASGILIIVFLVLGYFTVDTTK